MNNASCRCFRFPIDIGRTSMPCLVATPTVVPYHAGQEEYFNGLLAAGRMTAILIGPSETVHPPT
jgi:hypothetical protein